MKTKIFIPSKGRVNNQPTFKALQSVGLEKNVVLVVEPQEAESYKEQGYPVLVLPDNNQGISFSRNFILDYCRENKIDFCIQMDDDINGFCRKKEDKVHYLYDNNAIIDFINLFEEEKDCIGMEYRQVAWTNKDFWRKGSLEVVIALYIPKIPTNVRFDKQSKEDKDFSIQLILNGITPRKCQEYIINQAPLGIPGGLEEFYASGKDAEAAKYMLEKWGSDIITLKEKHLKTGAIRLDAMVKWKNVYKKYEQSKEESSLDDF